MDKPPSSGDEYILEKIAVCIGLALLCWLIVVIAEKINKYYKTKDEEEAKSKSNETKTRSEKYKFDVPKNNRMNKSENNVGGNSDI